MFSLNLCSYQNLTILRKKNADVFAFTVISCGGHVLLLITTLFPTETCASVTQSNILATAFKLRKKGGYCTGFINTFTIFTGTLKFFG